MSSFSVVLVTATPSGTSGDPNAAFVKVDGRESALRAVELFLNREAIKQILLVVPQGSADEIKKKYGANLAFSGVKLVAGGARWIEQLQVAAQQLDEAATHVLVHDAARPAVPSADLESILAQADTSELLMLAAPARGAMLEVDEAVSPRALWPASSLMTAQTPQIYSRAKFLEVASSGSEPHASAWTLVKGSPLNLRLNGGHDAGLVKAMMSLMPRPKARPTSNPFEEAQW